MPLDYGRITWGEWCDREVVKLNSRESRWEYYKVRENEQVAIFYKDNS